MGNAEDGDPEAPAEASGDLDEKYERSLGWYATVVTVTASIFGVLLGIGLALLPATTLREKSLIIGACIALAVAGFTGVGAWQSARRFATTAVAAALAIVSLAALSIAADADASPQQHAGTAPTESPAGQEQAGNFPGKASAIPSGPTVPQPSASGSPVYVSENIGGDAGPGDEAPSNGTYSLGVTKYGSSLGYPSLCSKDASGPLMVTYPLSASYRYLTAELGIADGYAQDG